MITDQTRVDNEGCYADIRLMQKGNQRKMCHSRTKQFDPCKIDYPCKKFHPRKITHAKLSPKRTQDPHKFTHDSPKFAHVPRPTTHDPRSCSNPQPTQPTQFSTLKLERYSGTKRNHLYVVVVVSPLMLSLTSGQFNLCIKAIEGVSKLLFLTILAASFYNFCKVCSLVTSQHPHAKQQNRVWGSTIPRYMLLGLF